MAGKKRVVAAELRVDTSKISGDMREGTRKARRGAQDMSREISQAGSPIGRGGRTQASRFSRVRGAASQAFGIGGAGGMLKGAVAFGGVYGAASELKKAKAFEEVLVDLAVRGRKSKEWLGELRKSTLAASNEFGVGKEQIAAYAGEIIDKTGNVELAVGTMREMTAVAFAANVPMEQLAGTVVELSSKLALQPKEFTTALGILAEQADVGKVPLSQMAQYLPEVLNAAAQLGHKGVGALRDYGAVLQMAARGTGSLAEANTAMNRMMDNIIAKRTKIEATLGIKLKKNGAWLQLAPMLKLIAGKLAEVQKKGENLSIFNKRGKKGKGSLDVEGFVIETFGIRGKKAMLPLMQQAAMGWKGRVGSKDGKGGLTSLDALIAAGGAGSIKDRVSRKKKLSPELFAWNQAVEVFKNSMHEHLRPALVKLGAIMPSLAKWLGRAVDHWKLLLAIYGGAKIAKFFWLLRRSGLAMAAGGGGIAGVAGTAATATAGGRAAMLRSMAMSMLPIVLPIVAASAVGVGLGLGLNYLFNKLGGTIKDPYTGKPASLVEPKKIEKRLHGLLTGDAEWERKQHAAELEYGPDAVHGPSYVGPDGKRRALNIKKMSRAEIREGRRGDAALPDEKTTPDTGNAPIKITKMGRAEILADRSGETIALLRGIKDELKNQRTVTVVDPNKTPAAVTDSRRGKK